MFVFSCSCSFGILDHVFTDTITSQMPRAFEIFLISLEIEFFWGTLDCSHFVFGQLKHFNDWNLWNNGTIANLSPIDLELLNV